VVFTCDAVIYFHAESAELREVKDDESEASIMDDFVVQIYKKSRIP
jgi:hypothetical protein